jgi:hypothetical protein
LRLVYSEKRGPRIPAPAVGGAGEPRKPLRFVPMAPPRLSLRPTGRRQTSDLARLVRQVARRKLVELRDAGGRLSCQPRGGLIGRWDRRWSERAIDCLLSLALQLIPGATVALAFRQLGSEALVEAVCSPSAQEGGPRPFSLAHLTRSREQWERELWLLRAVVRVRRGRVTLLHDALGPIGIRLFMPLSA